MMDEAEIKTAIAADASGYGWVESEFDIEYMDSIVMPPCKFVEAIHQFPGQIERYYAVFPDSTMIGKNDELGAQTVLEKCSLPIEADAWAKLLNLFHWGLGLPRFARIDDTVKPTLSDSNSKLRFRLEGIEVVSIYDVTVSLNGSQIVSVEKTLIE